MALWLEKNLPALLVGAGLGAIVAHWLLPSAWPLGALAGIGIALPLWQVFAKP